MCVHCYSKVALYPTLTLACRSHEVDHSATHVSFRLSSNTVCYLGTLSQSSLGFVSPLRLALAAAHRTSIPPILSVVMFGNMRWGAPVAFSLPISDRPANSMVSSFISPLYRLTRCGTSDRGRTRYPQRAPTIGNTERKMGRQRRSDAFPLIQTCTSPASWLRRLL